MPTGHYAYTDGGGAHRICCSGEKYNYPEMYGMVHLLTFPKNVTPCKECEEIREISFKLFKDRLVTEFNPIYFGKGTKILAKILAARNSED